MSAPGSGVSAGYPKRTHIRLSENFGGEIGEIIDHAKGKQIKCGACLKMQSSNHWFGWYHEDGYEDVKGRKWWLYFKCPNCEREFSYWKLKKQLH